MWYDSILNTIVTGSAIRFLEYKGNIQGFGNL